MRLMISGGGTGGHVYPALAVVQTLEADTEMMWVGSSSGMEKELIARTNIPYQGISAGGLRGKNPVAALSGLLKLGRGYRQSRRLLKAFEPDVLFVTGGYVCVPMTLAAHQKGIPILIYLPDIEPGQAIKFISRYATRIAVTAPPAQAHFPAGLSVVTGYPVREGLAETDPSAARQRLGLHDKLPVTLVFGGSQGARSINQAITKTETLHSLLKQTQLIHVSGKLDAEWTQEIYKALPHNLKQNYHLYAYLHEEMIDALAAADLVVSRAGAATLGELPASGTPGILIPLPISGGHQWPNAAYLARQGAAIAIDNNNLETELFKTIETLLNNSAERQKMAQAARSLARPNAAQAIGKHLKELSAWKQSH